VCLFGFSLLLKTRLWTDLLFVRHVLCSLADKIVLLYSDWKTNQDSFADSNIPVCKQVYVLKKVKGSLAVNGTPSHSYGMSLAIWDLTVLPATRHKRMHPALTPAMPSGTRFTYPGGMEGWVDLVDLIAPRLGVEPATFRSRVQRQTTAPPTQPETMQKLVISPNAVAYQWQVIHKLWL